LHAGGLDVDHDDLEDAAEHTDGCDLPPVGRPAWLGPELVVRGVTQHAPVPGVAVEQHEARAGRHELHGDDASVATHVGLQQPRAVGEALLAPVALDVQVGAHLLAPGVLHLRKEQPPTGMRHVGPLARAPAEPGAHAAGGHRVGGIARAAVAAGVDDRRIIQPARVHGVPRVRRQVAPSGEGCARDVRDAGLRRVAPLAERAIEAGAEGAPRGAAVDDRDERGALLLDEVAEGAVAASAREIVDEHPAVRVHSLAAGKARRAAADVAEPWQRTVERGGPRDGAEVCAAQPSAVRELRLVVHGQPLGEPRGGEEGGKEQRHAPEHLPPGGPDPTRAVEVKDVRELVRHDQLHPVLGQPQPLSLDGRSGEDGDTVRRKRGREAVGKVDVVGDDELDGRAGRMQLA